MGSHVHAPEKNLDRSEYSLEACISVPVSVTSCDTSFAECEPTPVSNEHLAAEIWTIFCEHLKTNHTQPTKTTSLRKSSITRTLSKKFQLAPERFNDLFNTNPFLLSFKVSGNHIKCTLPVCICNAPDEAINIHYACPFHN